MAYDPKNYVTLPIDGDPAVLTAMNNAADAATAEWATRSGLPLYFHSQLAAVAEWYRDQDDAHAQPEDYVESKESRDALVRDLDVLLNGEWDGETPVTWARIDASHTGPVRWLYRELTQPDYKAQSVTGGIQLYGAPATHFRLKSG